jgi:hypothetical protein
MPVCITKLKGSIKRAMTYLTALYKHMLQRSADKTKYRSSPGYTRLELCKYEFT